MTNNDLRLLGIDFGLKRIGLALTRGQVVIPLKTIVKKDNAQVRAELGQIIVQEKIQALVVGLPYGPDGQETLTTRQAKNFAQRLRRHFLLPVYLMDETCSSLEAEERLKELGLNAFQRKERLDQVAACIILEDFLTSKNKS